MRGGSDSTQLRRLFAGNFGDYTELYGNVALEGKPSDELNSIESVFGLYQHSPHLRFYSLCATTVDAYWFPPRIAGYEFAKHHQVILGEQLARLNGVHPNWRDEGMSAQLWQEAQESFSGLGLPMSFFSYQIGLDGTHSVVFWYPRLVPADAMLKTFKLVAAAYKSAL